MTIAAPARYPSALERSYRGRLLKRVRLIAHVALDEIEGVVDERSRAPFAWVANDVAAALAVARRKLDALPPNLGPLNALAAGVDTFTTASVEREVARARRRDNLGTTTYPTRPAARQAQLDRWARENARLIVSVHARHLDAIAKLAAQAVTDGTQTRVVMRQIRDLTGTTEARARTIARTEIAKLNSAITTDEHAKLGITSFEWSTSGDERVRPEHAALDGKVFAYDDPPAIGLPGAAGVNCRCVALAVLDDEPLPRAFTNQRGKAAVRMGVP